MSFADRAAFRAADEKASLEIAHRELERELAGEERFLGSHADDWIISQLKREAILEKQRANPGSTVRVVDGGDKLFLPQESRTIAPRQRGGILDLLNQEDQLDEESEGGLPIGWLLVAGVVLVAGALGVLVWRSKRG